MLAALILCAAGAVRARAQSGVADIVRRGWIHGHARPPAAFYETAARSAHPFEFSHGWLARARAVRQNRQALRARGAFNLMNAQARVAGAPPQRATAVSGSLRYPTFMPFFSNTSAADRQLMDSAAVQAQFWGASAAPPYSVTTYYKEISTGRLTVTGQVIGRGVSVSHPGTFYSGGPSCQGLCTAGNVDSLIREILSHADSTVDFSQFADTSALVNNAYYVPGIVILDPQVGAECYQVYAPSDSGIWAHRFSLTAWWNLRGGAGLRPFVTRDSVNGKPVVVDDYIIQGGQGGPGGCTPGVLAPIGTVTHETGHLFGLPDLYDTDESFLTEGLGHWDLMASGAEWKPFRPAHMSAWSLSFLGWIDEVPLGRDTTVQTAAIEVSDTAFVVPIAGTPDNEFFLLENRQPIGSDSMMHGPGLMIYHVDTVLMAQRMGDNAVNASQPHAIWILEAAGDTGLDCTYPASCNDRGDAGDPFPGDSNNTALGLATRPPSATNAGAFAGVIIDRIQQVVPLGAMSFRVSFAGVTVVKASLPVAQVRVRGVAMTQYQNVLATGDTLTISMDSAQASADGRYQFTFVSWSDGGGRTHTITGAAAGGTYVAQVSARYLARYVVTGGGSVSASRPVDAVNGTFFSGGDSVTLTATPATGQAFLGWTGDTTVAGASLKLRMARPFSVTANFAAPRDVVNQLLAGSSPLTPTAVLLLDQLGNNNGRFDLGDLVAWLDRNPGIATSPVMLKLLRKISR